MKKIEKAINLTTEEENLKARIHYLEKQIAMSYLSQNEISLLREALACRIEKSTEVKGNNKTERSIESRKSSFMALKNKLAGCGYINGGKMSKQEREQRLYVLIRDMNELKGCSSLGILNQSQTALFDAINKLFDQALSSLVDKQEVWKGQNDKIEEAIRLLEPHKHNVNGVQDAIDILFDLTLAEQPEQKVCKWTRPKESTNQWFSSCGETYLPMIDGKFKFCPSCGGKIESEGK